MRCNYHSNRPCKECGEHDVSCNACINTENEGGESFRYCDEPDSKYYGDCVEDAVVCCLLFKPKL